MESARNPYGFSRIERLVQNMLTAILRTNSFNAGAFIGRNDPVHAQFLLKVDYKHVI